MDTLMDGGLYLTRKYAKKGLREVLRLLSGNGYIAHVVTGRVKYRRVGTLPNPGAHELRKSWHTGKSPLLPSFLNLACMSPGSSQCGYGVNCNQFQDLQSPCSNSRGEQLILYR